MTILHGPTAIPKLPPTEQKRAWYKLRDTLRRRNGIASAYEVRHELWAYLRAIPMASLEVMTREEYKAAQQRREKRQKYYKKRNKLGDKVVVYENMEFDMQEVAIRKESRKVDAILTEMHGDLIEAVDEMRAREKAEAENNAYYGEW